MRQSKDVERKEAAEIFSVVAGVPVAVELVDDTLILEARALVDQFTNSAAHHALCVKLSEGRK